MAEGWIAGAANLVLTNEAKDYTFVQLHTAAPGPAGTTAVATEADRMAVTWGTAAAGAMTTTTDAEWTSVAGTEDYTRISVWTLASGGSCGFTGLVTANPVVAGDTFTIAASDLDVSIAVAT